MCARYTNTLAGKDLIEELEAILMGPMPEPHFNIAPTTAAPILIRDRMGQRRLGLSRFGFESRRSKSSLMVNARVETVAQKISFKAAFARRRCLVLADGFIEWQRQGSRKIPHRIRLPEGGLFAMAGIWQTDRAGGGRAEDGSPNSRFAILTREAVGQTAQIHDRMPILIPAGSYDAYLDRALIESAAITTLLDGHLGEELIAEPVQERLNRVGSNERSLLKVSPLSPPPQVEMDFEA